MRRPKTPLSRGPSVWIHTSARGVRTRADVTRVRSGLIAVLIFPAALAQTRTDSADRAIAIDPASPTVSPVSSNPHGRWGHIFGLVEPTAPLHLTAHDKFRDYLFAMTGPLPLLGEAASAGIRQWKDSPPEWGQGWGAYGHRFASNMGYNAVRQTIIFATSAALREDTRFYLSEETGAWRRTRHALLATVTARQADGRRRFSISSVAGVVGASAVSRTWGPPHWRTPMSIATNSGVSLALSAGFNVAREFLPDILRHFGK